MSQRASANSAGRWRASWGLLRIFAVVLALFIGAIGSAQAEVVEGSIVFTRYKGTPNIQRVNYRFDGASLVVGGVVPIATTEGANGIIALPDGEFLVGGQADLVHKVRPDGDVTSFEAGGTAAHHLTLDPSGSKAWAGGAPGPPAEIPLAPFGVGLLRPLQGDDIDITQIIFDDRGRAFYTSGAFDGWGNFGRIDLASFRTTRLISGLEAAHGITFDPYSGDLILFGGNMIAQIDPDAPTVVKSTAYYSLDSQFDVGRTDGKGHLFATRNDGYLVFVDYDSTRLVGAKENVERVIYVDSYIDDLVMVPLIEDDETAAGAPPSGADETPPLAEQGGEPNRQGSTPGGSDEVGNGLARASEILISSDTSAAEDAQPPSTAETVATAAMTAAAAATLLAALGLALGALPRAPGRAGVLAAADGFMATAAGVAALDALTSTGAGGVDIETGALALASAAALLAATAKLANAMPGRPASALPEALPGAATPALAGAVSGSASPSGFSGGDTGNVSSRDFAGHTGTGDARGLSGAGQGGGPHSSGAPAPQSDIDANGAADTSIVDEAASTAEKIGWSAPLTALAGYLPKRDKQDAPSQVTEVAGQPDEAHGVLDARPNPLERLKPPLAAAAGALAGVMSRLGRKQKAAQKTPAKREAVRPRKSSAPKPAPEENRVTYLSMTVEEIVAGLRAGAPAQEVAFTIEPNVTAEGPLEAIRPAMRAMLSHAWARTDGVPSARIAFGMEMRDGTPAYFVADNGAPMAENDSTGWPVSKEARGGRARLDAAQKIAQRHGGRLWPEARPDGETALYLTFSKPAE